MASTEKTDTIMKGKMKKQTLHFSDTAVIYHSQEDNCWIAHSLRTDQIGTGDQVVDALADLLRGVRAVLRLAEKDESIAYLREAPGEIKKLASRSKKLPGEIFEIAYRHATGGWPKDWTIPEPMDSVESFTAQIIDNLDRKMEEAGC